MNHLPVLRTAIRATYGYDCEHVASLRAETIIGDILWSRTVEQFTLKGCPNAEEAFGWIENTAGRKQRAIVILRIPPVETPGDAVKAVFEREFWTQVTGGSLSRK